MLWKLLFLRALALPLAWSADTWLVIVAGSSGYQNYRHQADACHAYQVGRKNGIPADRIILMIYDDIANNEGNPFPGKLYNTANGTDVYAGCKIDYSGVDVSMENFFKVIEGDTTGLKPTQRVLKSTAEDDVMIFYTDHGAPGYVTFPSGVAMYTADLTQALVRMHDKGRYNKALFYMDACNSGSMFNTVLAPNLLAVTAANPNEESFATFCPPYDKVITENNRETFSCLGDIFSIGWVLNSLSSNLQTTTVGDQIDFLVKDVVNGRLPNPGSHVMQYGDLSIRDLPLQVFESENSTLARVAATSTASLPRVSTRDVPLHLAQQRVLRAPSAEERTLARTDLARLEAQRESADRTYTSIAHALLPSEAAQGALADVLSTTPTDEVCYKTLVEEARRMCGLADDYTMRYSGLLQSLCATQSAAKILIALHAEC